MNSNFYICQKNGPGKISNNVQNRHVPAMLANKEAEVWIRPCMTCTANLQIQLTALLASNSVRRFKKQWKHKQWRNIHQGKKKQNQVKIRMRRIYTGFKNPKLQAAKNCVTTDPNWSVGVSGNASKNPKYPRVRARSLKDVLRWQQRRPKSKSIC